MSGTLNSVHITGVVESTLKEETIVNPNTPANEPHSIIFEQIDGQLIHNTVLKMDGAAGPSGLDAAAWK